MEIIKIRKYGEPKLKLPKELNKQTFIGIIKLFKNCSCKVWKVEDIYYILHRDWFSPMISYDKALKAGIIDKKRDKFIYNDDFGGVVLRNEALFTVRKEDWYVPTNSSSTNLCINFSKMVNDIWCKTDDWEFVKQPFTGYFEQFLRLIQVSEFENKEHEEWCGIFKRVIV